MSAVKSLRMLAGAGVLVGLLVFGASSAVSANFHGIAFAKTCEDPTAVGDPLECAFQIANFDFGNNSENVFSLSDVVNSAGGAVPSGELMPSLELTVSPTSGPGKPTCTGPSISGDGTPGSPYTGATACTVPLLGSSITTSNFSHYNVQAADFGLPGHILTDQGSLGWKDNCDVDPVGCNSSNQTATAPGSTTVTQLPSTTTTLIHNAAHQPVTTVEVGSTVHDFVTVTGQPGQPTPQGNVNIDWFLNGDCSGNPVNSGSIGPLDGAGQFDAVGFAFTVNSPGMRAFRAHYEGGGIYLPSDGACEPLQVVDANIQLTPPTATNQVGTNHPMTCHINVNDGTGFANAPAGTTCTGQILSGPGSFVGSNQCQTVGATGDCTLTISSNSTGQTTIRASTDVVVGGISLHRATGDAHAGDSADAQKLWVNAAIVIAPNATNEVGQPHTFTVTVLQDTGGGFGPVGAGLPCNVTLTNGNGAVANPAGPFNLTTNAAGQCSVTFTSQTGGTVTGHASSTVTINGVVMNVETDGVAPNSGNAVKTFVDANIQLTPANAANAVGTNHTLHCHINVNDGSGGFTDAPAGTTCTVNILSGPGTPASQNCNTVGATGTCDVVITSATTGTTVLRAITDVVVGGVSLHRETGDAHAGDSADAQKQWVNAAILIAPNATNEVGQPHTFTVTVLQDTGSGLTPVGAGEPCNVTLTGANGANPVPAGPFNLTTNASGQCTVTFTSATGGTVTGHASSTLTLNGVQFTIQTDGQAPNSGDAVKTFVDANIQLTPATATNPVGTNHVLTCHINVNDGSGGFTNAPAGTTCTVNILSGPGTPTTQNCQTVGATGDCQVTITSATPGTTTLQATTTLSVGGVTLTRTTGDSHAGDGPNAVKLWADDTVATHVRDAANNDITNQTVNGGTVVHDEATVSKAAGTPGGVPDPTGTVDFTLFDNGTCNGNVLATDPGKPLNGSGVATSADFTTPATGSFSYLAHYNGDANYPAHNGPCEPFDVATQTGGKDLAFKGSMEGALRWMEGAFVNGGYHFWLSEKNPVPVTVTVTGFITLPVHCGGPSGPMAGVPITWNGQTLDKNGNPFLGIKIPVPLTFTIPANSTAKWLTPDQNNILSWMNAVQSGALCGAGQLMYNSEGASFEVNVVSSAHTGVINFQWHYRIPAAKNKPNTNCTDANDPNRNRADVCGASWSATKEP